MTLTAVQQRFVLHWGEMGTRWGINRSVAQIHALLFLSPRPLDAEQIAETLGLARSNVSTSVRELQSWGIVRVVHVLGDRRDHFETEKDPWELFRTILEERKRREIDPTIAALRECLEAAEAGADTGEGEESAYTRERIAELLEFFELASSSYQTIDRLPRQALVRLAKLSDRLPSLLGDAA